jgi:hypothetical protein
MRTSPVPTVTLTGFVTADPFTITGLVTVQEKFILQLLALNAMTQDNAAGVRVPDIVGLDIVTAVHALQLFPSFDSAIVPVFAAELLSAQARMFTVPTEENVIDLEETAVAPAPRATIFGLTR